MENQNFESTLAKQALTEQRKSRRWGIFFKSLTLVYLVVFIVTVNAWLGDEDDVEVGRHTAVVDLDGVIAAGSTANADDVISGLEHALESKNSVGVILRINSPGGSPVQSAIINQEIRRLRANHPDKPIVAVVEDLCASGGYYAAVATQTIYVSQASIVGSIGVRLDGFDLSKAMESLGIQRRLLTAGENKGFLDPFQPMQADQKQHALNLLANIHQQFIDAVKEGRSGKLATDESLFSGLIWTGEQGIQLGLVDSLGTVNSVARDVFQAEKVVNYSVREGLGERLARRLGTSISESLFKSMFYKDVLN